MGAAFCVSRRVEFNLQSFNVNLIKMLQTNELLDIKEASNWATEYLGKIVTPSNISYLIPHQD